MSLLQQVSIAFDSRYLANHVVFLVLSGSRSLLSISEVVFSGFGLIASQVTLHTKIVIQLLQVVLILLEDFIVLGFEAILQLSGFLISSCGCSFSTFEGSSLVVKVLDGGIVSIPDLLEVLGTLSLGFLGVSLLLFTSSQVLFVVLVGIVGDRALFDSIDCVFDGWCVVGLSAEPVIISLLHIEEILLWYFDIEVIALVPAIIFSLESSLSISCFLLIGSKLCLEVFDGSSLCEHVVTGKADRIAPVSLLQQVLVSLAGLLEILTSRFHGRSLGLSDLVELADFDDELRHVLVTGDLVGIVCQCCDFALSHSKLLVLVTNLVDNIFVEELVVLELHFNLAHKRCILGSDFLAVDLSRGVAVVGEIQRYGLSASLSASESEEAGREGARVTLHKETRSILVEE